MPLLDHFHPPLSQTHPWRGFHGAWAAAIARLLNGGVLPAGFYAVPFLDRDGPVEVDVATLRDAAEPEIPIGEAWSPAEPEVQVAVEWSTIDDVRVEIFSAEGDPRLAAAIELVSPRNKDRSTARTAFASKCVGYLQRGCGLVVVDVVTTRRANLHSELLELLGMEDAGVAPLSAVAYRAIGREDDGKLLAWPSPLEIGRPLPTVPLWLFGEFAVRLDLEASHSAACKDLRIRQAS